MTKKSKKLWKFFPNDLQRQQALARELQISTILAKCLLNRSITDPQVAKDYLWPELGQLIDPFRFHQMEAAVARIQQALVQKETILIHGDYDVDGVSGTVLLLQLFQMLGAKVRYHIPNRLRDGYSFSSASLEKIAHEKASLVITIDNGITAYEPIYQLNKNGVDVIITDHHKPAPKEALPPACAILNPNLPDSGYPHADLCGVGVAFKLAWAVAQSLSPARRTTPAMKRFLLEAMGWVAVGSISDIVPLRGENRVFAKFGLLSLERSQNIGIQALLQQAGLSKQKLSAQDVAFRIAPRLNAAGRLGAAEKAVELLTTSSSDLAASLAEELERNNELRRSIERKIYQEACELVQRSWDFERWPVLVLGHKNWHAGVVGIVCSKLVEEFHAPTILVAFDGYTGRGSARSLAGFPIHQAIAGCADLLAKFGGHAQAAGLEIEHDKLELFRDRVNEAAKQMLIQQMSPASSYIDAEISLCELTPNFMQEVALLSPFGAGNGVPVFATKEVKLAGIPRRVGKHQEHLQCEMQQAGKIMKAIAFGMGERMEEIMQSNPLTLVYTPKIDSWAGRQRISLEIQDFLEL